MSMKALAALLVLACGALAVEAQSDWQRKVKEELPLLGHRNWILIADSAYPLQTSSGIETIETGADQLEVIDYVLKALDGSVHVKPIVHTDAELPFVSEKQAPGVERYRQEVRTRIARFAPDSLPHEVLIAKLKETGETFHVLVLKTRLAIPYSSVFLQLDCRYWTPADEATLREAIKHAQ